MSHPTTDDLIREAIERAQQWRSRLNLQAATLARSRALFGDEPTRACVHWLLENELWARIPPGGLGSTYGALHPSGRRAVESAQEFRP